MEVEKAMLHDQDVPVSTIFEIVDCLIEGFRNDHI